MAMQLPMLIPWLLSLFATVSAQWKEVSVGNGTQSWAAFAMSVDDPPYKKMLAGVWGGNLWTSSDSGYTWQEDSSIGTTKNWIGAAMSADGTKMAAVNAADQSVWLSSDGGSTWQERSGLPNKGNRVAMSADGTKIAANGPTASSTVLISSDSGASFQSSSLPLAQWSTVAISPDGTTMAAGIYLGRIWISSDSGANWEEKTNLGNQYWRSIALSEDGTDIMAAPTYTWIYSSTDKGATWATMVASSDWVSVSMSADGRVRAAVATCGSGGVGKGKLWTSTDRGATWQEDAPGTGACKEWYVAAVSPDANGMAAVVWGENIWLNIQVPAGCYNTTGIDTVWQDEGTALATYEFDISTSPDDGTPGACADHCDATPGCNGFAKCHSPTTRCFLKNKTIADPSSEPVRDASGCTSFYAYECATTTTTSSSTMTSSMTSTSTTRTSWTSTSSAVSTTTTSRIDACYVTQGIGLVWEDEGEEIATPPTLNDQPAECATSCDFHKEAGGGCNGFRSCETNDGKFFCRFYNKTIADAASEPVVDGKVAGQICSSWYASWCFPTTSSVTTSMTTSSLTMTTSTLTTMTTSSVTVTTSTLTTMTTSSSTMTSLTTSTSTMTSMTTTASSATATSSSTVTTTTTMSSMTSTSTSSLTTTSTSMTTSSMTSTSTSMSTTASTMSMTTTTDPEACYTNRGISTMFQQPGTHLATFRYDITTDPYDDGTSGSCTAHCDSTPDCNGFNKCDDGFCYLKTWTDITDPKGFESEPVRSGVLSHLGQRCTAFLWTCWATTTTFSMTRTVTTTSSTTRTVTTTSSATRTSTNTRSGPFGQGLWLSGSCTAGVDGFYRYVGDEELPVNFWPDLPVTYIRTVPYFKLEHGDLSRWLFFVPGRYGDRHCRISNGHWVVGLSKYDHDEYGDGPCGMPLLHIEALYDLTYLLGSNFWKGGCTIRSIELTEPTHFQDWDEALQNISLSLSEPGEPTRTTFDDGDVPWLHACEAHGRGPTSSFVNAAMSTTSTTTGTRECYKTAGNFRRFLDEGTSLGEVHVDPAEVFTAFTLDEPGQCADFCDATPGCNGFTKCSTGNMCWLKNNSNVTDAAAAAAAPWKTDPFCRSFYYACTAAVCTLEGRPGPYPDFWLSGHCDETVNGLYSYAGTNNYSCPPQPYFRFENGHLSRWLFWHPDWTSTCALHRSHRTWAPTWSVTGNIFWDSFASFHQTTDLPQGSHHWSGRSCSWPHSHSWMQYWLTLEDTTAASERLAGFPESFVLSGSCDETYNGNWSRAGILNGTSPRKPYYKLESGGLSRWMYWDPLCNGVRARPRWVMDDTEPSATRPYYLNAPAPSCRYGHVLRRADLVAGSNDWREKCGADGWLTNTITIVDTTPVPPTQVFGCLGTLSPATPGEDMALAYQQTLVELCGVEPDMVEVSLDAGVACGDARRLQDANRTVQAMAVNFVITFPAASREAANTTAAILQTVTATEVARILEEEMLQIPSLAGIKVEITSTPDVRVGGPAVPVPVTSTTPNARVTSTPPNAMVEEVVAVPMTSTTPNAMVEADGGRVAAAIVGALLVLGCIVLVAKKLLNWGNKEASADAKTPEAQSNLREINTTLAAAGKGEEQANAPACLLDEEGYRGEQHVEV